MIFKTINTDIDKSIAKIGIFNKSLWAMQQDLKHGNGLIFSLFGGQSVTNKDRQAILDFNTQLQNGIQPAKAWATTMSNCSIAAQTQARECLKAKGNLVELANGFQIMTISAKAGQVALKGLAIAGNMLAMWGISVAIQAAVKWIDRLVHSAEYAEQAIKTATDSAKSFTDSIKNIQNETADMEKSINSIIDRYAELSQGVNTFTNENKSLPTEQYEEFLGLNKQLTELFPSLTRNYDENGNAILGLSGSVDSVTESIRFLVEQEKELAKAQIRENLEKYFNGTDEADGAWKVLEGKKQELEEANEALTALKDTYEGLINTDTSTIIGQYHKDFVQAEKAKYIEYIKDSFGDNIAKAMEDAVSIHLGKGLGGQFADIVVDFSSLELTEAQKEQIARSYDTFYSELLAKQKTAMSEFESQNSEFSSNAMLWLEDLSFYKDSDKYIQTAIQNLVRNIDWTDYDPEGLDYEGIKRILQDSVLTPFQTACEDQSTKDALNDALKGLFSLDMSDMPVTNVKAQVDSYIDTIATILGEDPLELKIKFGFDNADDTVQKLSNSIYGIANDGNSKFKVNSQDYLTLIKYTKDFNAEQAELWLKATMGINGAANAISAYENALKSADNEQSDLLSPTIASTIDQLNTQLKPAFDALKEAYLDIFTTDDNGKEVFTLENVDLSMLDEIKSAIDDLNGNEDLGIYIDYSSFDNLANVLTDTKSTAEDVHNAINAFAGEIIQSINPSLGETTEETYQFTQAMLKSLGVMNSEEVMASTLGYSLEELAELRKAAASAGFDLENATDREIRMFIWEQTEAGNCSEALYLLQLKKVLLNQTAINTTGDIEYILGLAQSAGVASNALAKLADAKAMLETATAKGDTRGIYEAKKYARELQNEIRNDIVSFEIPEIKFEPPSDNSKKKSSSEKDTTETFDWIEQAIENVEKEIQSLDETVNSAYSTFSQKNKALADEIGKVNDEINLQQKAYDEYMRKAESVGLSDQYKSLVQSGDINIEDIKDENLQKQIDEYQKWYDKAQEANEAIKDLKTDMKDLYVSAYELQTENLKDRLDSDSITQKEYLDQLRVNYALK